MKDWRYLGNLDWVNISFYFSLSSPSSPCTTFMTGNTCCSREARMPLCSSSSSICCNLRYLLTCSARTGPPSLMKRAPKATAWSKESNKKEKKISDVNKQTKNCKISGDPIWGSQFRKGQIITGKFWSLTGSRGFIIRGKSRYWCTAKKFVMVDGLFFMDALIIDVFAT